MNKPFRLLILLAVIISLGIVLSISYINRPKQLKENWVHLSSTAAEIPKPGASQEQTATLVLDVNKDGLLDFVVGARKASPALTWFKRNSTGWQRYIIDSDVLPIEAGGAFHDIDGDGDYDIVMGEDWSGKEVFWWENPYPNYQPTASWTRHTIKENGATKQHDQIFGDFDNDGKTELVFWNQGAKSLLLTDIPPFPKHTQTWNLTPIFEAQEQAEGLTKADIDGDGIEDIIGAGRWFKYKGENHYEANIIDLDMVPARAAAGQLVQGGPPEVVFVIGDDVGHLKWYEWKQNAWHDHDLLGHEVSHGHSLAIADINKDGNQDIFCAEMHTPGVGSSAKAWIFFGDGKGGFTKSIFSIGLGNHESKVADLDGDGDVDILSKPYTWTTPRIDIWLNRQAPLDHWRRHVIDANKPWRTIFVDAADLDADGIKDIVTGGWWYKNPGTPDGSWQRKYIGEPLNNMATIYDFDNDGDLDILGTEGKGSKANAQFVWASNNGKGEFTIMDNIQHGEGDFLQGAVVQHLWGNKLAVALSWHATNSLVQLLEVPDNPSADQWKIRTLSEFSQDEAVSAGDIDHDGDNDLLLGTAWLRDDSNSTTVMPIANDGAPDRNRLVDINHDGWLDALVGFEAINKPGELVWYQNPANNSKTWIKHNIGTIIGPMSVDVGDLDGDGDYDVVAGEHNMKADARPKLYVFENKDGDGLRWIGHVAYIGDEHHDGAKLTDIDNDGDLDIISIGWSHGRVLLYENLGSS
jgi:hypothetical protein